MDDDLESLVKVLPSVVEWGEVEEGIAVRPVNQPALKSVVKMPADVRDKVWEWLSNPRVVEDADEWEALRKPIISVLLEIAKITIQYGDPIHKEIFTRAMKALSKSDGDCF